MKSKFSNFQKNFPEYFLKVNFSVMWIIEFTFFLMNSKSSCPKLTNDTKF